MSPCILGGDFDKTSCASQFPNSFPFNALEENHNPERFSSGRVIRLNTLPVVCIYVDTYPCLERTPKVKSSMEITCGVLPIIPAAAITTLVHFPRGVSPHWSAWLPCILKNHLAEETLWLVHQLSIYHHRLHQFQSLLQGRRRSLPRVRRDEVGLVPRGGKVEGGPGLEGAAARRPAHPLRPPRQQERHGRLYARKF